MPQKVIDLRTIMLTTSQRNQLTFQQRYAGATDNASFRLKLNWSVK